MAHTVIGFFDDAEAAQKAADGLAGNGISSDRIDISRSDTNAESEVLENKENENGITRFFKALFGDNDEAERYSKIGRSGCTLVTVHAQSRSEAELAANLLDDYGAINVDERAARADNTTNRSGEEDATYQTYNNPAAINPINEAAGNRNKDRSDARARSRIVEQPIEDNVRMEQNPIDNAATNNELQNFKEGEIVFTEYKEVPIINKEARVVEEIRITKETEEHNQTIREKVRETKVDIDRIHDTDNTVDRNNMIQDGETTWKLREEENRKSGDPLFGA